LPSARLGAVDVHVADLAGLEPFALVVCLGQGPPEDVVPLEAAVEGAAAEVGDGVPQRAHDIVQRQQGPAPECDDDGFFGGGGRGAGWPLRPHGASAVVAGLRHFRTVLGLSPYWAAMALDGVCAAWSSVRTRGVMRAQP